MPDQLRQASFPALARAQREHVLEVLVAESPGGLSEALHDRPVVVRVRREDLAITLHRILHRWRNCRGSARGDADRERYLTEEQWAAPDADGSAHDRPGEAGLGAQPEQHLMHRFPPVEFGVFGVAPDAGQVRDDPQPVAPEDPASGVGRGGACYRVAEMRPGHGFDLLVRVERSLAWFLHEVGLVREHQQRSPHPR